MNPIDKICYTLGTWLSNALYVGKEELSNEKIFMVGGMAFGMLSALFICLIALIGALVIESKEKKNEKNN